MFRSALVGQSSQPVQFAKLLIEAGHEIVATSSPDADLGRWSRSHSIPHFTELAAFGSHCSARGLDFLFSIVNYRILPPGLLRTPSKLAVNYHDGPLPRYAGLYATTWALLNQETVHGVTWHVMEERPDAGDIIKQAAVRVTPTDTAASLNLKCFLAAARSFRILLTELNDGVLVRTPQDLTGRSYFGRHTPLPEIDPSWPPERIDAYRRALDFGDSPNPFVGRIPLGVARLFGISQPTVTP